MNGRRKKSISPVKFADQVATATRNLPLKRPGSMEFAAESAGSAFIDET